MFSDQLEIERKTIEAFQNASFPDYELGKHTPLSKEIFNITREEQAQQICKTIPKAELN